MFRWAHQDRVKDKAWEEFGAMGSAADGGMDRRGGWMMESVAGRKLPALTRNVESSNLQDAAGAIAREDNGDDENSR